jgi:NADH-quinone oxidoreductase subunit K
VTTAVLHNYLVVGAILFALGAIGFLTRRNLIVMFLSAEMMLQGVALNLVGFGGHHRNYQGQAFVIFLLTVAACEAGIALALILVLYRSRRTLDVSVWQDLREEGQEPIVDDEPLPAPTEKPLAFPPLTPAGLLPTADGASPVGATPDAMTMPTVVEAAKESPRA